MPTIYDIKSKNLILEVEKIKNKYDKERQKDRFNIFYALHKEHDEVNLHSRFISYLLANNSGHGKASFFAKLFFEIVLKNKINKSFLNEYEVIPNEFNKTEFEEIDILLINKSLDHSIIIENKIFAKDSNHDGKDEGYNGQLERYYNTIRKGKNIGKGDFKAHKYMSKNIDIFYLTLNSPKEDSFNFSKGNIPETVGVKELYYKNEIVLWLEACLNNEQIIKDEFLKRLIKQYLILVKNMTKTNVPIEEINDLKKLYSENIETTQYLLDNFKHIKWHTVNDFFNLLNEKLISEKFENVSLYPELPEDRYNLITKITHNNENLNVGVLFSKNNNNYYISSLNNLSWGNIDNEEWFEFKNTNLENVRLSDFSTLNTHKLIDFENTKNVVNLIIEEISKSKNENFNFSSIS